MKMESKEFVKMQIEKLSKKYHETDISTVMDLLAFRVITQDI